MLLCVTQFFHIWKLIGVAFSCSSEQFDVGNGSRIARLSIFRGLRWSNLSICDLVLTLNNERNLQLRVWVAPVIVWASRCVWDCKLQHLRWWIKIKNQRIKIKLHNHLKCSFTRLNATSQSNFDFSRDRKLEILDNVFEMLRWRWWETSKNFPFFSSALSFLIELLQKRWSQMHPSSTCNFNPFVAFSDEWLSST